MGFSGDFFLELVLRIKEDLEQRYLVRVELHDKDLNYSLHNNFHMTSGSCLLLLLHFTYAHHYTAVYKRNENKTSPAL